MELGAKTTCETKGWAEPPRSEQFRLSDSQCCLQFCTCFLNFMRFGPDGCQMPRQREECAVRPASAIVSSTADMRTIISTWSRDILTCIITQSPALPQTVAFSRHVLQYCCYDVITLAANTESGLMKRGELRPSDVISAPAEQRLIRHLLRHYDVDARGVVSVESTVQVAIQLLLLRMQQLVRFNARSYPVWRATCNIVIVFITTSIERAVVTLDRNMRNYS